MNILNITKSLSSSEKRTFGLHTAYMVIEGFVLGILALNEFVFIKSLHGSNYQLSFLFQFSMLVFLFLIVINEYLKRVKNRKKLLRRVALISRLPLLILLLFPVTQEDMLAQPYFHYIFLLLFLIYFSGNIFINPNINYLLKVNYKHHNFGKLYSYATSINKIVMLVVTFAYGYLLDYDNFAFVYIIPVGGLLGIVSIFILSEIKYPEEEVKIAKKSIYQSIEVSVKQMYNILKENKPYRHFEIGFMYYGFSFMISVTVVTIYFYEALDLNYASVAFYRNSYNILAIILLPFFGYKYFKSKSKYDLRNLFLLSITSATQSYIFIYSKLVKWSNNIFRGVIG